MELARAQPAERSPAVREESHTGKGRDDRVDDALLRAFLGGDEAAFAALVRRHGRMVLGVARRCGSTPEEARDIAQRAFLRVMQGARRTAARGDVRVRAWFARIAANLARNAMRDSTRRAQALAHGPGGSSPESAGPMDAEAALLQAERAGLVRAAVLRLPRRQRQVLSLRVDAGLSFREIAEALEIAEGNARVQHHHAMRSLRAALACAEEEP
jgi:RNA polymerase sigma-70 factor (ECF subfamily)